jgi:signal transduction histidine kinase
MARALFFTFAALFVLCVVPSHAFASVYGKGNYGSCGYTTDCSTSGSGGTTEPPPPVEVTLPSGLEVSINLTDDQVIPPSGYTVTITPLNGQGSSFDHAEIYVNGQLITTVKPDDTGTAHWDWDPSQVPGNDVKIVIFDTDGKSVAHDFHVKIGTQGGGGSSDNSQPGGVTTAPTVTNPVQRFVQNIYHGAKNIVRNLPKPIIYSFPYILFVLLGVNIFLLLLQVKRELSEYEALLARFEREKVATESKRTLMELVAHYLRTPLTVIRGGIDMLLEDPSTSSSATMLTGITQHLQANIEAVIERMHAVDTKIVTSTDTPSESSAAFWRQPGLFAPLILIAAVVFSFDYLARQSDKLTGDQVIFATHIIIYTILAVVLYQVFRRLQLHKRDTNKIQHIVAEEQATNQTRDTIVDNALTLLEDDLTQLDSTAAPLNDSSASKFIQDGQTRFHEILTNLKVAATLRGSHNTEPYVMAQAVGLLSTALQDLQAKADTKGITVDIQSADGNSAAARPTPSPELVAFVLHTTLDNAIAYSPENSTISVLVAVQDQKTIVTITDHGLGITADKQSYLFQPFSKAEGAETFTHEGMGFSLYLARLIMTYIDGSIALTSSPNQGTVVTIEIPTQPLNDGSPLS